MAFDPRPDDRAEWLVTGADSGRRRTVVVLAGALAVAILVLVASVLTYQRSISPAADPPPELQQDQPSGTTSPTAASTPPSGGSWPPRPSGAPVVTQLNRSLLGVTGGWEIIGYGSDGVVRIEPARGRITVNPVPGLMTSGPVTAAVGQDFIVIRPWDEVEGYLVRDGRPAQPLRGLLASAQTVAPGPDGTHLWAASAPRTWSSDEQVRIQLVDSAGRASGPELPVPAGSSGFGGVSDGTGHLVIDGTGGTYAARADGLAKITAGELLAVGPTRFLTVDCDERAVCQTFVVDRRTGARRSLGAAAPGSPAATGVISPDGRYATIVIQGDPGGAEALLVDLTTGRRQVVEVQLQGYRLQAQAWSPDGRWLFMTDQTRLYAVDPATATATPVAEVSAPMQLLTIRPAPAG